MHQSSLLFGRFDLYKRLLGRRAASQIASASAASFLLHSTYPQGHVFDYTYFAIEALCAAGFRVIFVTNARKFDPAQLARLKPWCAKIIKRRNVGYDFGAYREGVFAIDDFSAADALILMNDSVYGPRFALDDTLNRMSLEECDIGGLTDSWAHAYHLQSYFYYFRAPVLKSPAFLEFWRRIPLVNYKPGVVERLEIELSQYFLTCGYRLGAAFQYFAVAERFLDLVTRTPDGGLAEREMRERLCTNIARGRTVNPTHYFWDVLIREFKCPFIKGELISYNPESVYGINRCHDIIAQDTEYDARMIVEHLKRSRRRRWYGYKPITRN